MSQIYMPEVEQIAEIERLELEARNARRRIEHVVNIADKRVLNRQLRELEEQITFLQARLR